MLISHHRRAPHPPQHAALTLFGRPRCYAGHARAAGGEACGAVAGEEGTGPGGRKGLWIWSHLPEGPPRARPQPAPKQRLSCGLPQPASHVSLSSSCVEAWSCGALTLRGALQVVRFVFRDSAARAWWAGSFRHVYRAPQRAYLRWSAGGKLQHISAVPAAPPAPSFASAPLAAAPRAASAPQAIAPLAAGSVATPLTCAPELQRASAPAAAAPAAAALRQAAIARLQRGGAQLQALRARVHQRSAEQLVRLRGRLASAADAAPAGAGQRAMAWLREKRQAYQLVLQHRVTAY